MVIGKCQRRLKAIQACAGEGLGLYIYLPEKAKGNTGMCQRRLRLYRYAPEKVKVIQVCAPINECFGSDVPVLHPMCETTGKWRQVTKIQT